MDFCQSEDDSDTSWTEECFDESGSNLEDELSESFESTISDDDTSSIEYDVDTDEEDEDEDEDESEEEETEEESEDEVEGDECLVDITKPYTSCPINMVEKEGCDEVTSADWGNLKFWIMLRDGQQIAEWFEKRKVSQKAKGNISKVFSPLNLAARVGSIPIFNFLLGEGFPIVSADHPFLDASLIRKFDIMDTLLNLGADVNVTDSSGKTALHLLAKQLIYQPKKIKYLLSKGANINLKDNTGTTPLHYALVRGTKGTVSALVKAGASVHDCTGRGRPVLHMAVYRGLRMTSFLYKAGARPGASTEYSEVDAALKIPNVNILRFLIKRNAPIKVDFIAVSKIIYSSQKEAANRMIDLLVGAGYRPPKDAAVMWEIDKPKNMYIVTKMTQLASNPTSLQELTCFCIRDICRKTSRNILDSVDHLPIPETLKDYILLKHVTETQEDVQ